MKLSQSIISISAGIALASCQTALYNAIDNNDAEAVRRELKSGESLTETAPASNWWWKIPVLPFAVTADIAETGLIVGTLGIGGLLVMPFYDHYDMRRAADELSITTAVWDYGKTTPLEKALEASEEVQWIILESGKAQSEKLANIVLTKALARRDYTRAAQVIQMGADPNMIQNDETLLINAFANKDEEKIRFLVELGADINKTTSTNSCQFIAQENNMLPLFIAMGGIMVDEPVAPPVQCIYCQGTGSGGMVDSDCLSCGGTGKTFYSNVELNTSLDVYETRRSSSMCLACWGTGKMKMRASCSRCNGTGKVSRYVKQ